MDTLYTRDSVWHTLSRVCTFSIELYDICQWCAVTTNSIWCNAAHCSQKGGCTVHGGRYMHQFVKQKNAKHCYHEIEALELVFLAHHRHQYPYFTIMAELRGSVLVARTKRKETVRLELEMRIRLLSTIGNESTRVPSLSQLWKINDLWTVNWHYTFFTWRVLSIHDAVVLYAFSVICNL